jgi:small GTP-binding protein
MGLFSSKKSPETTHDIKVLMVGDSGVGKTKLFASMCGVSEVSNGSPTTLDVSDTVGVTTKNVVHNTFNFRIWNISGKSKFGFLVRPFSAQSVIVLFCFDSSNRRSFTNIGDKWFSDIRTSVYPHYLLVSTRNDRERTVSVSECEAFSKLHNMTFVDTSLDLRDGRDTLDTMSKLLRQNSLYTPVPKKRR